MPEEKEIPTSAGKAAAEFANDNENIDPSQNVPKREERDYSSLDEMPTKKKSAGKGWKAATFIFLILALCGAGFCAYLILVKDNPITGCQSNTEHNTTATKCDVKEENKTEDPIAQEGAEPDTSIDVLPDTSNDYVVQFKKSGIKLNLGSKYTVINASYAQQPSNNAYETVLLGGLSENTSGAQNMPNFAVGSIPAKDFSLAEQSDYWLVMETIYVYNKSWWDAQGMDQKIAGAEANGVATSYNVIYRDDEYVVTYTHPQNIMSDAGWQRDWEEATYKAFEQTLTDSANWTR